ncbi:hypothetical protein D3C80_1762450 [compost metagenome]
MALLDVTEVLLDPDFMGMGLVCKRNAARDNLSGLATEQGKALDDLILVRKCAPGRR